MKDDYEYDMDGDGNTVRIRITRKELKARLKAAEKRAGDASRDRNKANDALRAAERRMDNIAWCDRLKAVLDDGVFHVENPSSVVESGAQDVSGMGMLNRLMMPTTWEARLTFTLVGDESVLRLGEFLRERR